VQDVEAGDILRPPAPPSAATDAAHNQVFTSVDPPLFEGDQYLQTADSQLCPLQQKDEETGAWK